MRIGNRRAHWGVPLIAMLALAAGTKGLPGQQVGGTAIPAAPAVKSAWPDVNLNLVVLDEEGAPQKVDEQKFQLFENGVERSLRFEGSPDSPVSLALVIDSSGSMFKRKAAVISAVKAIVRGLPDGSEVMAVDFSGNAFIDFDFTAASKADFSFLDRLQSSGPSAVYDALIATEDHISKHAKYARRALIILSDGEDNASHSSRKMAFGKMEQLGAPVVYACFPSKANMFQRDLMIGHINMRFLAKWGGGAEVNLDPDPEAAAAQIADAIRSQYVLQFTTADPTRDGKERKLAVRLPDKKVQIYAPPGYFAPAK